MKMIHVCTYVIHGSAIGIAVNNVDEMEGRKGINEEHGHHKDTRRPPKEAIPSLFDRTTSKKKSRSSEISTFFRHSKRARRSREGMLVLCLFLAGSIHHSMAFACPRPCSCLGLSTNSSTSSVVSPLPPLERDGINNATNNNNKTINYSTVTSVLPSISCSNQSLEGIQEITFSPWAPVVNVTDNTTTTAAIIILAALPGEQQNNVHRLHLLDLSHNAIQAVRLVGEQREEEDTTGICNSTVNGSDIWVKHLDLSHNMIKELEATKDGDASCVMWGVLALDLSFNNVSDLDALVWSSWFDHLQDLNLSHNAIHSLGGGNNDDNSLSSLIQLRFLDLSFNQLQFISPAFFKALSNLRVLCLNNNRIKTIDADLFQPPPMFSNMKFLDLSHNALERLPSPLFGQLPTLVNLSLADNSITFLKVSTFTNLPRLEWLSLDHLPITSLAEPLFQNTALRCLSLSSMPLLQNVSHDVFLGLEQLTNLNLSRNVQLRFFHPNTLTSLQALQVLDLSYCGIQQLSEITFHQNKQLQAVHLRGMPLSCTCTNAWLAGEAQYHNFSIFVDATDIHCLDDDSQARKIAEAGLACGELHLSNMTDEVEVRPGSTLMLQCQQISDNPGVLRWTTPMGKVFYYHNFHPEAIVHLLSSEDVQPRSPFHANHYWHESSAYHSEVSSNPDRILILSDGSLYIDYMLRQDTGEYRCEVSNSRFNLSSGITIYLEYTVSGDIKIFAFVVGFLCALGFFTLNLVYVIITWIAHRLVNKRRREIIGQMLENLNTYKSTQITRIHENYTHQLNRVRNQYHIQRDRLQKNYTVQATRVKKGCSNHVERVRDNYNSKLAQLRDYSSSQVVQIRERANTQIGRIRDYGSLQLDRLRETYKLQQQHVLKLLDTMNLENCRSVVETECMRTESMMFDIDLLGPDDQIDSSTPPESEYSTAASSPNSSGGFTLDMESSGDEVVSGRDLDRGDMVGDTFARAVSKNTNNGGEDIHIEMNTALRLPGDLYLEARETWRYSGGRTSPSDHTLYTKLHNDDGSNHVQDCHQCSKYESNGRLNATEDHDTHQMGEASPAMLWVPLPTVDLLSPSHGAEHHDFASVDERLMEYDDPTEDESEAIWKRDYVTPDASPVRVWKGQMVSQACDSGCRDTITNVDLHEIRLNMDNTADNHEEDSSL